MYSISFDFVLTAILIMIMLTHLAPALLLILDLAQFILRVPLPSLRYHLELRLQDLLEHQLQACLVHHDLAVAGSHQLVLLLHLPLALRLIRPLVRHQIPLPLLRFRSRRFGHLRIPPDLRSHLLPCLRCRCCRLPFQRGSDQTLHSFLALLQAPRQGRHST